MRRLALFSVLLLALAAAAFAQERAPEASGKSPSVAGKVDQVTDEGHFEMWKWANFVILAGVLGWLIWKHAPAFFRTRTEEIQRGIAEASRVRADAEARVKQMDARMAALESEIEALRAEAKTEMVKEVERLRDETEKQLARIQKHGEQEIAAAAKHAQNDLRGYSAQLAIQLAGQRIRSRISGQTQNDLFDRFLRDLDETARSQGARQ